MKQSFMGYLIIILGIFILVVLMLVQELTSTSEQDYYNTKEIMEAAMIDAVDYGTYRTSRKIRIIKEKFVENFLRRFAESVNATKDYNIEFFEISESPPKATVRISTKTGSYTIDSDTAEFDIITTLSGILETKY